MFSPSLQKEPPSMDDLKQLQWPKCRNENKQVICIPWQKNRNDNSELESPFDQKSQLVVFKLDLVQEELSKFNFSKKLENSLC